MNQRIHTGDFLVLAVDLLQCHGKALKPVDTPGHREQVDHIPALENLLLPLLQSPFRDHARAKAMKMLTVHGIHDAAVRIYADKKIMFSLKRIENRHFRPPSITYGYQTYRSMHQWDRCP